MLSHFLFAVVVNVTELAIEGELLYADDLAPMSETTKGLQNR